MESEEEEYNENEPTTSNLEAIIDLEESANDIDISNVQKKKEFLDTTEPEYSLKRYFKYFKGSEQANCRICTKSIKRKDQSTTGMISHLKSHQNYFKNYDKAKKLKQDLKRARSDQMEPPAKQLKIEDFKLKQIDKKKSNEIDNMILRFICLSCEPLSFTEKNGFKDLMNAACPSYELKKGNFFTSRLETKYVEVFELIKSNIQTAESFCFTTDIWSNKNKKKSFLSLTIHYIDKEFCKKFRILSTQPFYESHTGQNIKNCLENLLLEFGINAQKIHLVLRDAQSSMISGISSMGFQNFDCFIHKLQLAINDAIEHKTKSVPKIREMVQAGRDIVSVYNRSLQFRNALVAKQREMGLRENVLIQDVCTRWNSTFALLNRLYEQRAPLILLDDFTTNIRMPDFELLKNVCQVLEPFDNFTKQLSKREECISAVLPIYRCLLNSLQKNDHDSDSIAQLKNVLSAGLESRMEQHIQKKFLIIATLIDPRFKNNSIIFNLAERRQNAFLLTNEAELTINPNRRMSDEVQQSLNLYNPSTNTNILSTFLESAQSELINDNENENTNKAEDEVNKYLKMPLEPIDVDPLNFWRKNSTFPNLKKIAKVYLCPPPSTVKSERTFSKLSEIYKPKRFNLSSEHAKQQLFLHFNYDI